MDEPAETTGPKRGRVLVVDDEPSIGRMLGRLLRRDHDVVTTTDPGEALRLLTETDEDFDIILCDVTMPHLSGPELHEAVHAVRPALAERMVFLSGGAFTPEAEAFLARMDGRRLDKPMDLALLKQVVASMVG